MALASLVDAVQFPTTKGSGLSRRIWGYALSDSCNPFRIRPESVFQVFAGLWETRGILRDTPVSAPARRDATCRAQVRTTSPR